MTRPDINVLVASVANYFDQDIAKIRKSISGLKNMPRSIAIYICRELGGYSLVEIGKFMGGVSYKAISNAIHRISRDKLQVQVAERFMYEFKREAKSI